VPHFGNNEALLTPVSVNGDANFTLQHLSLKHLQRQHLMIFNPLPKVKSSIGVLC
jgi:hypothetical protein